MQLWPPPWEPCLVSASDVHLLHVERKLVEALVDVSCMILQTFLSPDIQLVMQTASSENNANTSECWGHQTAHKHSTAIAWVNLSNTMLPSDKSFFNLYFKNNDHIYSIIIF